MILPDKAGAVIRWKYRYDGVFQYQVAVLTYTGDYDEGLRWHRPGWGVPWTPEAMQETVDTSWGVWEIMHPGEEEE